jgi:hypothetical protein
MLGTKEAVELPEQVPFCTVMTPVVAPEGTTAVICKSLTTVKPEAETPLNRTAVAPVNPDPLTVTTVLAPPEAGAKELTTIWLGAVTVKEVIDVHPFASVTV